MKINYQIDKLVCPASNGSLLADHCSGAFLKQFTRAALLTVVLGVAVGSCHRVCIKRQRIERKTDKSNAD